METPLIPPANTSWSFLLIKSNARIAHKMQKFLLYLIPTVYLSGFALSMVGFRELRVVGGFDINITQVPYQLAMEYSGSPFCSGTIISNTYVLTASHCVERFNPLEVVMRSGTSKRGSGGDILKIRNVTRNPKFSISQLDYDVAAIELESPMTFTHFRRAVEFASEEPIVGAKVTVSGWGKTSEKGSVAGTLKSAVVKIIDRDMCREHYRNMVNITERMFCAGADGQDSCGGDSGAPATISGKLVGIVSWGYGCARESYPGVYTNLLDPEIRNFIRNVTGV